MKKFNIIKNKDILYFKLENIKDKTERMIIYNNIILKNIKNLSTGKTIMIVNENQNGGLMVGLEKNINRDKKFLKDNYKNINFYNKEKINNNYYNVLLNIRKENVN